MAKAPITPPTIADIAKRLNLARSTVSMALRNRPEIAASTRARVANAAAELGYRPNPLISLLMSRLHEESASRTDTVLAAVCESHRDWTWRQFPLFEKVWAGLKDQASRRGYRMEEFEMGEHAIPPARLADILRARGIPAAFIAPHRGTAPSTFTGWEHFSVSTINWSVPAPEIPRATFDYFRNYGRAFVAAGDRGYRRIGFITDTGLSERLGHVYLGAHHACAGLLPPDRRVQPLVRYMRELHADTLSAWLRQEKPDAVLVTDPEILIPLLASVTRVPEDLAVAALELACAPAGTAGIDERVTETAAAAIDLLVGQLQRNERGIPEVPRTVQIPGVWREGSTLPPRGR